MLDIQSGDFLTVNSKDYPISYAGKWSMPGASSFGFSMMATLTASTKRNPAKVNGVSGAPVTKLSNLLCMPLDPVNQEILQKLHLEITYEALQTVVSDGTGFIQLILEDVKP